MAGKVLVEVKGGLGNQLFQYAAGLELATIHGKDLLLDTRMLDKIGDSEPGTKRKLALPFLGIKARSASTLDLLLADFVKILTSRRIRKIVPVTPRILKALGFQMFRESSFHYEPLGDSARIFTLISGYFQSEKYFRVTSAALRGSIFQDLVVSHQIKAFHRSLSIRGGVCVNVRRGDYVESALHGALSQDYYQRAVAHIESRVGIKPIYVFSDDLDWCRENLSFEGREVRFVEHNLAGPEFTYYLYLMSLFENYVISNSTFAWWAVWLSQKESPLVVAPKTWFMGAPETNTSDLIRESWTLIHN